MIPATKPLLALTAADLMSRDVVTLPREMSLRAAAQWLAQARVSGAPVVDDRGRCVGVLSAIDFVLWARAQGQAGRPCDLEHLFVTPWQCVDLESLPADQVSQHMTTDLVTASPDTRVGDLAGLMTDARVRRVVIVDGQGRPVGIVSSTDIMSAVAEASRKAGEGAPTSGPVI
jgi:CBS-domain-containing membrane protein